MRMSNKKCDLSVIIITKNEEKMITDCIDSVLSAISYAKKEGVIQTAEVILSDSASTDKTIDIAKKYPLKIVQLDRKWQLSAAAGLYIGFLQSKGRHIQILGGDHVLDKEWLVKGLPILKSSDEIAAVQGFEAENLKGSKAMEHLKKSVEQQDNKPPGEVDYAGTAIFKSNILEKIGPYNPYLKGGEDRELSYRLVDAGYKILSIPYTSTIHYWGGKTGKLTLKTMLKSAYKWGLGDGQAARYNLHKKNMVLKYLKRYFNAASIHVYSSILSFFLIMYVNFLTMLLIPKLTYALYFTLLLDLMLLGLGSLYAVIKYKSGKLDEFIFSFRVYPDIFVRHIGFILGFLKKPKDPSTYPTDVKIIKE